MLTRSAIMEGATSTRKAIIEGIIQQGQSLGKCYGHEDGCYTRYWHGKC